MKIPSHLLNWSDHLSSDNTESMSHPVFKTWSGWRLSLVSLIHKPYVLVRAHSNKDAHSNQNGLISQEPIFFNKFVHLSVLLINRMYCYQILFPYTLMPNPFVLILYFFFICRRWKFQNDFAFLVSCDDYNDVHRDKSN